MDIDRILIKAGEKLVRLKEVEEALHDPQVTQDLDRYKKLGKEMRELGRLKSLRDRYEGARQRQREASGIALDESQDKEWREMARVEAEKAQAELDELGRDLEEMILPSDPLSVKNAVIEVRAGTGGVEASLFASEIVRMYARYAVSRGFKVETLGEQNTEAGGVREMILLVSGEGVFGRFKYESGVHRVQRVPVTEASGRIHTSAITVAVLPEVEEVDANIRNEDLRIEVFRSGGPGGQSVNTTDSAVRITHTPSGLVVKCQDEKSQIKNKAKALKILRARLFDKIQQEQQAVMARERQKQIGSGDRSEKIRTYNFPERRVTDHRINLTIHALDRILEGDLDAIVDALKAHEQEARQENA